MSQAFCLTVMERGVCDLQTTVVTSPALLPPLLLRGSRDPSLH